ncbi:uncharacterized protein VTP21DRAFT_3287 [Calcarisporiella thermophila]|uniref:uncharacterized protein n=1 Tax=Calcarisporiella thermophila TaxID=911321 RepID=UPI003743319B
MVAATLVKFSLVAACIGTALGHGKLIEPRGFNVQNPVNTIDCKRFTSDQPCGTGVTIPAPENPPEYAPGSNAPMTWRVANVDGAGPLRAYIDPTGTGQNFKTALRVSNSPPGLQGIGPRGTFNIAVAMPTDVDCQGPGGACLLRVQSPTGFASCTWVKLGGSNQKAKRQLPEFIPDFLDPIGIQDTIGDTIRDPLGQVVNTAQGLIRGVADIVGGNERVGNVLRPVNLNPLSGVLGGGSGGASSRAQPAAAAAPAAAGAAVKPASASASASGSARVASASAPSAQTAAQRSTKPSKKAPKKTTKKKTKKTSKKTSKQ